MKFENAQDFFSKNDPSASLNLVLITRCTDEDVSGFPRALLVTLNAALIDRLALTAKMFDKGGFRHVDIDATDFVQPLYLDGDIRQGKDGWTDPCDFSIHFEGEDNPLQFTATVTDEDEMLSEGALVSGEVTCAELDSLFGASPSKSYIKLDARTFAKLEDLESQIDRALSEQVRR
jgi:hypothetical protein